MSQPRSSKRVRFADSIEAPPSNTPNSEKKPLTDGTKVLISFALLCSTLGNFYYLYNGNFEIFAFLTENISKLEKIRNLIPILIKIAVPTACLVLMLMPGFSFSNEFIYCASLIMGVGDTIASYLHQTRQFTWWSQCMILCASIFFKACAIAVYAWSRLPSKL